METDKIINKLRDLRFDLFVILTILAISFGYSIGNRRIMNSISQQLQLLEQHTITLQTSLESVSTALSDTCSNTPVSGL